MNIGYNDIWTTTEKNSINFTGFHDKLLTSEIIPEQCVQLCILLSLLHALYMAYMDSTILKWLPEMLFSA